MRFGFFLMPCHGPTVNPTLAYEEDLRLVEFADDLGYDEFWIGEHHSGGWELIPSPEIFIAAASQRTKHINMGTGVIGLPHYHPFLVAERMAFLDHLTRGRTIMGVGPGALPTDVRMFGIDPTEMRPMMDESLEIILKLYREDGPITYEGKYWTLNNMELQVKPYQQPHMPLAVASIGNPHSLTLAGQHGMRVLSANVDPGPLGDGLAKQWNLVEQVASENGRTADRDDWMVQVYVYLADSAEKAFHDIEAGAEREMREYWYHLGVTSGFDEFKAKPGERVDVRKLKDARRWIIGNPDECIRRLNEINETSGGVGGFLLTVLDWTSRENWNESLKLFARYVMPELKKTNRGLKSSASRMAADAAAGLLPSARGGDLPGRER